MTEQQFRDLMKPVIDAIAGKDIDQALADDLNREFPPESETFRAIEGACHAATAAGWMCGQGAEGRRFGRVIEPGPETGDLSVDVVQLRDIVGPHHSHPTGEVCMIMPMSADARFDGIGAGWCVNGPGSAHHPTVTGGEALVLYLLPGGKIEFTKT
jgi:hypothetical protein